MTTTAERLKTWQCISTAPKDGTYILLGYFLEGGGGGEPVVAMWHSAYKKWANNKGLYNATGHFSPTHWMPLPPPPDVPIVDEPDTSPGALP